MKTLSIPGFKAEASLFTMDKHYRQARTLRPTNLDSVQPASSCHDSCIGECFANGGSGWCISYCRSVCGTPRTITFHPS
jgi:hypothetical protein